MKWKSSAPSLPFKTEIKTLIIAFEKLLTLIDNNESQKFLKSNYQCFPIIPTFLLALLKVFVLC